LGKGKKKKKKKRKRGEGESAENRVGKLWPKGCANRNHDIRARTATNARDTLPPIGKKKKKRKKRMEEGGWKKEIRNDFWQRPPEKSGWTLLNYLYAEKEKKKKERKRGRERRGEASTRSFAPHAIKAIPFHFFLTFRLRQRKRKKKKEKREEKRERSITSSYPRRTHLSQQPHFLKKKRKEKKNGHSVADAFKKT